MENEAYSAIHWTMLDYVSTTNADLKKSKGKGKRIEDMSSFFSL